MKQRVLKSFLVFILLVSILPFAKEVEAATSYSGKVKVSKVTVYEKASTRSKKIGSIKKGVKIKVYSKSSTGWAKIDYKKKKAYVLTKYLTITNSTPATYLMNKSKIYQYEYKEKGKTPKRITMKFLSSNDGWNYWSHSEGLSIYIEKQSTKYLYMGVMGAEYTPELALPYKLGKTWKAYEEKYKIVSVGKTIKTKAGTFKNCIGVKDSTGTSYYAKGIGLVRSIDKSSTYDLIKISSSKTVKSKIKGYELNLGEYFNLSHLNRQAYLLDLNDQNPSIDSVDFWELYDYINVFEGEVSKKDSIFKYIDLYLNKQ